MASNQVTPTCRVIHGNEAFHGKQGLDYFTGVTAESAGATGLCMHMVTIPPVLAPTRTCTSSTRRRSTSSVARRRCGSARA
jgi:uncharacterized RmlC-like cupin family protein